MATIETSYYEVLGVGHDADGAAIKAAYRRLAMDCHPDRNGGCTDAADRFKALNEAHDVLKDPQKRAAYDRFGKAAFQNGGGGAQADMGGFSDIFENIFGDFMGGRQEQGRRTVHRGQDLRYDLEMTLAEAYTGKEAKIEVSVSAACEPCAGSGATPGTSAKTCTMCSGRGQVRAQQGFFVVERACPTCHGAGQTIADPCKACRGIGRVEREKTLDVAIPRGVDDGTRIRLAGEGEAGLRGGPAGDLYLFIHLKPHAVFKREATTLFAEVPLAFTTAALGGTLGVQCLDGEETQIKIPSGTQPGKQFRVRGKGMPALQGGGTGDLVVQVEVETPVKLTKRQRELLEQFDASEADRATAFPRSTGFLGKLKGLLD
jgi:molecular chaperone DnaJ